PSMHAAAEVDRQVSDRPQLGAVGKGAAGGTNRVPKSNAADVDRRAEQLPGRCDVRAVARERLPRSEDRAPLPRPIRQAARIRKVRVNVAPAVDAEEDEHDLAVRGD